MCIYYWYTDINNLGLANLFYSLIGIEIPITNTITNWGGGGSIVLMCIHLSSTIQLGSADRRLFQNERR